MANLTPIVRKPMSECLTPICPACGKKRSLGEFERVGNHSWCRTCVKEALAICAGRRVKGGVPPKNSMFNTVHNRFRRSVYWQEPVLVWKREGGFGEGGHVRWQSLEPVTRVETVMRYRKEG